MDTNCVELTYRDGAFVTIDCEEVENFYGITTGQMVTLTGWGPSGVCVAGAVWRVEKAPPGCCGTHGLEDETVYMNTSHWLFGPVGCVVVSVKLPHNLHLHIFSVNPSPDSVLRFLP